MSALNSHGGNLGRKGENDRAVTGLENTRVLLDSHLRSKGLGRLEVTFLLEVGSFEKNDLDTRFSDHESVKCSFSLSPLS